jgi:uncharacterized iron-regulated membrane protein
MALGLIIAASTVAAFVSWWYRRPAPPATGGRLGHPAVWLAVVTALIYLNQVLFTVYVLRVRHGDPSFIAR